MEKISLKSVEKPILMIADLHLDPIRPAAISAFLSLINGPAQSAGAVFILGDLFEAWIGDDARPADDPVAPALNRLADHGVAIYLMHGNRDFLLGADFAKAAGATLLDEPTLVSIDQTPVLIEHGDALCTDDIAYQQFRLQVRDPAWQRAFLALPIDERIRQAQNARIQSGEAMADKSSQIMDVNEKAVVARFHDYGVQRLIHGHTHRPGRHTFTINGLPAERIVLGDWFEQGSVLRIADGEYHLESIQYTE